MTQSDQASPIQSAAGVSGHEGSASPNLSGRTVLAAWAVSIAVHAVAFAVMLALIFPFGPAEQTDLPLAHTDIVGALEEASLTPSHLPDLSSRTNLSTPNEMRFAPKPSDALSELAMARKRPELSIIGIGVGGGDFSRYGLRVGGGPGPEFFGAGGSSARGARRIVYVVDRSGSMLESFDYLRVELRRSIAVLRRSQKFHVIFFNSGKPLENPPGRLVSAINAQKERFFTFLSGISPSGGTDPGPALRRALANEPDLVYFLTDGQFDPGLIEKLDKWNRDRRAQIFTIAYVDRDGADLLERIAREHGGTFRFVSEDELP